VTPANSLTARSAANAEDLNERILVENPRDELGRLAGSFNELLDRVAAASTRERQFMADAAHELRTPISVIQTATTVIPGIPVPNFGNDASGEYQIRPIHPNLY
jgi:signal transduction histidine kinase